MDETNVCLSETALTTLNDGNSSDEAKNYPRATDSVRARICLIGELSNDAVVCEAAKVFGVPVITSVNGEEYLNDGSWDTLFVMENFDGAAFGAIRASEQRILGPTALRQYAQKNEGLPNNTRPLYCLAMTGLAVCFTGFRRKDELNRLITLIHNMGGSVRKDMALKVTHLIANCCGGQKYQYAFTFRVPIMSESWIYALWEKRNDISVSATNEEMLQHKLKPFHGAHVCFYGFPDEEKKHMIEVLQQNGGVATELEDPACTHVVVDSGETYSLLKSNMLGPRMSIPPQVLNSPGPRENSLCSMQWKNAISPAPSSDLCSSFGQSFELSTIPFPSNSLTSVISENIQMDVAFTNRSTSEMCWNSVTNRSLNCSQRDTKRSLEKKRTKLRRSRLSWSSAASITCSSPLPGFSEKKRNNVDQPVELDVTNGDCRTPMKDSFRNVSAVPLSETTNDITVGRTSWASVAECRTMDFNSEIELRDQQRTPDRSEGQVSINSASEAGSVSQVFKTPGSRPSRMSLRRKSDAFCKSLSFCLKAASPQKEVSSNTPADFQNLPHSQGIQPSTEEEQLLTTLVVDESAVQSIPEKAPLKAPIVKAEWFWVSVQNEGCADEKEYLFEEYLEAMLSPSTRHNPGTPSTPMSASTRVRKRKRLREAMSKLVQNESPTVHKRRSSVSDAGLLSMSGSFLDCTTSPEKQTDEVEAGLNETPSKILSARQQVFMELVQTESNYVGILHTIMTMFKDPLEKMTEAEGPLLNNTEQKIIFGNLPPIYEVHQKMLEELKWAMSHWKEDFSIGKVYLKFAPDLVKAYPPFVNFFETTKEMLVKCDQTKPRFHAFLKICQTKPECGRQSLQELLIRPVQRLPSISLLLNDILKHTSKSNADHAALEQALSSIREVMTHINEDKRKTEGQLVMFDIFNEIDNCPPHIVSSHRSFIVRCDVIELSEALSGRGDNLVLFLFSDIMEVCKKRSKAFNSLKSPNTIVGQQKQSNGKPYKHISLLPLSAIKRVIDIRETDDCHNVFALLCRSNQEMKEKLYSFILADEEADKCGFLKTLCRQVANTTCKTIAENLLLSLDSHQLNIDTSDVTLGTLSKAFKFASRTRLKVGRAFSFNKTPNKLKRAVSTMMSPFGSTTNLTPASQLAQMRLASCNNLNELGGPVKEESTYVAPMSVQPTRKNKCSSLNAANLRRL